MLYLTKKTRRDYVGEDIIVERTMEGGRWTHTTETVPNRITNQQISNTAIIIGNGTNRLGFDLNYLKKPSFLMFNNNMLTVPMFPDMHYSASSMIF